MKLLLVFEFHGCKIILAMGSAINRDVAPHGPLLMTPTFEIHSRVGVFVYNHPPHREDRILSVGLFLRPIRALNHTISSFVEKRTIKTNNKNQLRNRRRGSFAW